MKLLEALGGSCRGPGTVYITGGSSAVLLGWRDATIDVNLKFQPEPEGVFAKIPTLKHELEINIELAAPEDFVPALPGWKLRSQWITTHNQVDFYHFPKFPRKNLHDILQSSPNRLNRQSID